MRSFPDSEKPFLIEGPMGPLEVMVFPAKESTSNIGVICHPHPLHGGSMHNKVVHTISRAFHQHGMHALRFNYRGVGESVGSFGDSVGEFEDLLAVLQWVKNELNAPKFWLAGFSFGAFIAAKGATTYPCEQLFSIAPSVLHQPYQDLGKIICPWEVIQGEEDEVVPPSSVYEWVLQQQVIQPKLHLHKISDASHFFHGKLIVLRTLIERLLEDTI